MYDDANSLANEVRRITNILNTTPTIRLILKFGGHWGDIEHLCEPLGLCDTEFRDNPTCEDFLLNDDYWKLKLSKTLDKLVQKTIPEREVDNTFLAKQKYLSVSDLINFNGM